MSANEFTCEHYRGVLTKIRSEEEVAAEALANFGELAEDDQATICDGCYVEFMAWFEATE